ncbi:hypothetical protein ACJMK2_034062, partial [Sinanodonta woodiana]
MNWIVPPNHNHNDEEFLSKWATEANKEVLQKLQTKPNSVPIELVSLKLDKKSSPTKTCRIQTAKMRKKHITRRECTETMPVNPKESKIMQGLLEKSTVLEQTLKIDTPSSKLKERKQRKEATSCEISKQIFISCMADQFNNPAMHHMTISDQFTPFTETWAFCNNLADEPVNPLIQHAVPFFEEIRERNLRFVLPTRILILHILFSTVPSAEVNVLEQLCPPDNVQPTYTQLDTERPICTTPLPSSLDFGGIYQVKATFKAAPERSPRF